MNVYRKDYDNTLTLFSDSTNQRSDTQKYCGEGARPPFHSSVESMTVQFKSDISVQADGFNISYIIGKIFSKNQFRAK